MRKQEYFKVTFRIMGDELEPSKISILLGISPHQSHKKGEPNTSKTKKGKIVSYSPFNSGLWLINSNLPESSCLEDHINSILTCLEPVKDKLKQLSYDGYKMDIYCGYFTGEQAGFNLNNLVLQRMANLNVDFGINIYYLTTPHERDEKI
jgi:hypothetical protein